MGVKICSTYTISRIITKQGGGNSQKEILKNIEKKLRKSHSF